MSWFFGFFLVLALHICCNFLSIDYIFGGKLLGWFENGVFGINWKTPCSFGLCLFVMEDCYPYMELCEFRKRTHQNFSNWCCRHVNYFQNLSVFFCRKITYLVLKIVILWFNKIFFGLYSPTYFYGLLKESCHQTAKILKSIPLFMFVCSS